MLSLSEVLSAVFSVLSVLAAVGTAVIGFRVYKSKKTTDALAVGQSSLETALAWADKNNAALRKTIDLRAMEFEDHMVGCTTEILKLKERAFSAEQRLDAAEKREAACWARVDALTVQIEELQR